VLTSANDKKKVQRNKPMEPLDLIRTGDVFATSDRVE
jgi:hypothetical protein